MFNLLANLGINLRTERSPPERPRLLVVVIQANDLSLLLDVAALARKSQAKVLAILMVSDARMEQLALRAGAHAVWALDTSLDGMRAAIRPLLPELFR